LYNKGTEKEREVDAMTTLSIIFLIIIIYLIIGWLFAIICTTGLTDRADLLICLFWIITVPFVIIKEKILKK
jgi:hypothetical protein